MELIVDSFAGGGGASLGIAWATGRAPDVAINHDAAALKMHEANHPSTVHLHEDVWKAKPRRVTKGKKVGLLWASPDCRHFSRAKGGKPVSKQVRSLAWVVIKWAVEVKPRVIILENVREFEDWGPVVPMHECQACDWKGTEGQAKLARKRLACPRCNSVRLKETDRVMPDPKKKGITFRRWAGRLRNLGYNVEWRSLDAADYGAPTHRKRLFLVARRDGLPIVWPAPTHCHPSKITTGGLFADDRKPYRTAAECIDWSIPCPSIFTRKKPLADKTLRRIALGMKRYVLENPRPFVVGVGGRAGQTPPTDSNAPLGTITRKNDKAVIVPHVIHVQNASTEFRGQGVNEPMPTVTSRPKGGGHALVHTLMAPFLAGVGGPGYSGKPREIDRPIGTLIKENHHGVAAAYLTRFNHGDKQWNGVDDPLGTATSQGNKFGLVYAFLMKFFGSGGQWSKPDEPSPTATVKHRFAVVTVEVEPGKKEPAVLVNVEGIGPCVIADIGLRMLTPRELARAQGFPDTYELVGSKATQVAKIGNSVCPVMARVLVEANYANVPAGVA